MTSKAIAPRLALETSKLLSQLVGKSVRVNPSKAAQPTELLARYDDGSGQLISAWTFERGIAWSLGAALTMTPRGFVEEALKRGDVDQQLDESFHEVVNVLSAVVATLLDRRAVLESVSRDAAMLQRSARQINAAGVKWGVFDVSIEGYLGGSISVALVTPETD